MLPRHAPELAWTLKHRAWLLWRHIRPTLAKVGLIWHGYHAFRRGLATKFSSLNLPETDRTADSPAQAQAGGYSHALHPDSDARCFERNGEIRADGWISEDWVRVSCSSTVPQLGDHAVAKLLKNLVRRLDSTNDLRIMRTTRPMHSCCVSVS